MYSNYEYLLLKRFLFSKKTDGYISIFSWFSVIGITIGVSVIIIVMSVMNGFRDELTNRLLGINGHINIYSTKNVITSEEAKQIDNINNASLVFFPMIETQALIISEDDSRGVFIRSYSNKILNVGGEIAIASDYNPGSCTIQSMPLIMFLSNLYCSLPLELSFKACTYNSAKVLRLSNSVGLVEKGYKADLLIWGINNLSDIPYMFDNDRYIHIIKNGELIK